MRGGLILLYNRILTIFLAYSCERKKLLPKYNLAITILINTSFLTLSHTLPILLISFSFRPLASMLTGKIDPSNAVYKLPFLFTSRLVLSIPCINNFLGLFLLLLSFLSPNVARPFLIP